METSMRRCDLHTHTTHSDGTVTPKELVELAKNEGLSCIALTDHDTLSGVEEAQETGRALSVEVISGVEVSVKFEPGTLHILGYFVDRNSKELQAGLKKVQQARSSRNPKIIELLRAQGVDITLEEVEQASGGGQVGRPHFASVLIGKGYVKDKWEAFHKYLAKGAAAYVDKRNLSSKEAIDLITKAGGVASIAHPKHLKLDSEPVRFEGEVERLRDEGVRGIEVFSSCQSTSEAARYKKTAERFGLLVTGGSDFHGDNKPNVRLGRMGSNVTIPYETVDKMKKIILDQKLQ
jgi:3',5'-nucleoside bisphosphate phosphatase